MKKRDNKGRFVKGAIKTKECSVCFNLFQRNSKYSIAQWENAKTCSNKCRHILHRQFTPSAESNEKNRLAHLGEVTMSGSCHYMWKGGITPKRKKDYFSKEYKEWRKSVFERDNYTCQTCKVRGGELNADHIKPYAFFESLRYTLSNGRTLCLDCHRKTETWGRKVYQLAGQNI